MRNLKLAAALAGAITIAGVGFAIGQALSTGNEFATQTPGKSVVGIVQMIWNSALGYAQPVSSNVPLPVTVAAAPSGSGITPIVQGSAISGLILKASAGSLSAIYANSTAPVYLMVFNSLTAPSNGPTTPGAASGNLVNCIGPSNQPFINFEAGPPEPYSVGIYAAISTTGCATFTPSATGFFHGRVN